jgi:beta-ketoacyl synthase-like protein
VLAGRAPYQPSATVIPPLQCLPPAERRRTGKVVRLALTVGLEAVARAGANAATLPAVFSSSGGDGENCHEICQVLAGPERQISPTRFHNSVHNAASGYWGIATGATPAANALCAHDASFAAGLLESLVQLTIDETAVLLIAYDADYPQPMRAVRPIPDAFGVALLLTPAAGPKSLARLTVGSDAAAAQALPDAQLEALRAQVPAARSLPLLQCLARARPGTVAIDYLEGERMTIEVSPCP